MKKFFFLIIFSFILLIAAAYFISKQNLLDLKPASPGPTATSAKPQEVNILSITKALALDKDDQYIPPLEPVVNITIPNDPKYANQTFRLPKTLTLDEGKTYEIVAKAEGFMPKTINFAVGSFYGNKLEIGLNPIKTANLIQSKVTKKAKVFFPLSESVMLYLDENNQLIKQKIDEEEVLTTLAPQEKILGVNNLYVLYGNTQAETVKLLILSTKIITDIHLQAGNAAFSGSVIFIGKDKIIYKISPPDNNPVKVYSLEQYADVLQLNAANDVSLLALVIKDNNYSLLSIDLTNNKETTLYTGTNVFGNIKLSPDGKKAAWSSKETLHVIDRETKKIQSYDFQKTPQENNYVWVDNKTLVSIENNLDTVSNSLQLDTIARIDLPTNTKYPIGSSIVVPKRFAYQNMYYSENGSYIALKDRDDMIWVIYGF